jgi:hypothetical protein
LTGGEADNVFQLLDSVLNMNNVSEFYFWFQTWVTMRIISPFKVFSKIADELEDIKLMLRDFNQPCLLPVINRIWGRSNAFIISKKVENLYSQKSAEEIRG